jgi:hypothetical protein
VSGEDGSAAELACRKEGREGGGGGRLEGRNSEGWGDFLVKVSLGKRFGRLGPTNWLSGWYISGFSRYPKSLAGCSTLPIAASADKGFDGDSGVRLVPGTGEGTGLTGALRGLPKILSL